MGKLRSSLIIYILALDGSNLPHLAVDLITQLVSYLRGINAENDLNDIKVSHK